MPNITILPKTEAIKNLFSGLIINTKIRKIEAIVQVHTFFVPFE
jgi:hypothetical protein